MKCGWANGMCHELSLWVTNQYESRTRITDLLPLYDKIDQGFLWNVDGPTVCVTNCLYKSRIMYESRTGMAVLLRSSQTMYKSVCHKLCMSYELELLIYYRRTIRLIRAFWMRYGWANGMCRELCLRVTNCVYGSRTALLPSYDKTHYFSVIGWPILHYV